MTPSSLDLELDLRSFGNLDLDKSEFVFNDVGVDRPYSTSSDGGSKNFERSGTLSKGMELVQRSRFRAMKRACIFARIVSFLAE